MFQVPLLRGMASDSLASRHRTNQRRVDDKGASGCTVPRATRRSAGLGSSASGRRPCWAQRTVSRETVQPWFSTDSRRRGECAEGLWLREACPAMRPRIAALGSGETVQVGWRCRGLAQSLVILRAGEGVNRNEPEDARWPVLSPARHADNASPDLIRTDCPYDASRCSPSLRN